MKQIIDLNCDMGELHPSMHSNVDKFIMPYVTSCNIACGYHSGSVERIEQTVQLALEHHVAIGAHPSYKDRENFGRISLDVPIEELQSQIREQVLLVKEIVEKNDSSLHHVKPHGALYNDMAKNEDLSRAVLEAIASIDKDLIVYGLSGSKVINVANELSLHSYQEAFADRVYDQPNQLRSRKLENAVITNEEEVIEQVRNLLSEQVRLHDGKESPLVVDTICLHSDTKTAIQLAEAIHRFIKNQDIELYQSS